MSAADGDPAASFRVRSPGGAVDLRDVETPFALVDLERARSNAERVVEYCREHGLAWRPHVKTHKSLRIARLQIEAGASGLTVATPREAEVMAEVTGDLLLAYPPVGSATLARILGLPPEVRLTVSLDSPRVLEPLAEAARAEGREVGVLVELDLGMGRVGVHDPADAVALARQARETEGVAYRGVMFYPGHVRGPLLEQTEGLKALGERLDVFHRALVADDLDPGIVSGGSTPTLWRSHELPHLTEIRPGTCIYFDREGVSLGVAGWDDCAYTVVGTVVSTAVPDQVVVDAGSKALAGEARGGGGYGVLLERPEIRLRALSEEHGMVDLSGTDWRPEIGDRLRIVPNHVCVSVNLQDGILAAEGSSVERWELEARGRRPG